MIAILTCFLRGHAWRWVRNLPSAPGAPYDHMDACARCGKTRRR